MVTSDISIPRTNIAAPILRGCYGIAVIAVFEEIVIGIIPYGRTVSTDTLEFHLCPFRIGRNIRFINGAVFGHRHSDFL